MTMIYMMLILLILPMMLIPPILQVVFGTDNMNFSQVCAAMRKGDVKDGNVTLVLERHRNG
jgi:hypothetical protein